MALFGGLGSAVGGLLGGIGQSQIGQATSGFLSSAVNTIVSGQAPAALANAQIGQGVIGGTLAGAVGGQFLQNTIAKQFQQRPAQATAQVAAQRGTQFLAPPGGSAPQLFSTGVPSFTPVPASSFAAPSGGFGGPVPGAPMIGSSIGFGPALGAIGGLVGAGARAAGGVIARNPVIAGTVGGVLAGEALDSFQASGGGGQFFRATAAGASPISLVMLPNPVTGKPTFFKHAGRPILFSGDLTAAKRVNKLASRARRKR
jgi:hypothetical protein